METKQLTKSEKIELGTPEIAKKIRKQLRKEFPNCKFSVRTKKYAGGSSITAYLMEADFKVIRDFSDIPETALSLKEQEGYTKELIKKNQEEKRHQLSKSALRKDFNPEKWNNGVFLTEKAHNVLKRVLEIADQYNYDNSEPRTDYYDVNFSFSMEIGKWNEPFKRV